MQKPILVTADLHLTDRPRDEYRWEIFDRLDDLGQMHEVGGIFILGDITDQKDRHSAQLVNKLVCAVRELSELCPVYILQGNHDFSTDIACPFFKFLNNPPHVYFIDEPTAIIILESGVFNMLPYRPNPLQEWENLGTCDLWMMHQPMVGAKLENGRRLKGKLTPPDLLEWLKDKSPIISGDIHVPQFVGKGHQIQYVGAPYRVHFGDSFNPQILLVDTGQKSTAWVSLDLPGFLMRATLDIIPTVPEDMERITKFFPGDQLKVRVHLGRDEFASWAEHKAAVQAAADKAQVELFGLELVEHVPDQKTVEALSPSPFFEVTASGIYKEWVRREKVDLEYVKVGAEFIEVERSDVQ